MQDYKIFKDCFCHAICGLKRESEECRKRECKVMTLGLETAGNLRIRDLFEDPKELKTHKAKKSEKRIVRGTNCMRYLS